MITTFLLAVACSSPNDCQTFISDEWQALTKVEALEDMDSCEERKATVKRAFEASGLYVESLECLFSL